MPTYEYRCSACNIEFEVEKRMSEPIETPCKSCGSADTRRLISHSSFVLKGSGWYLTDYARKNGQGGSADAGGTHQKAAGNAGNDGASDSAPAAAATTPAATPAPSTTASSTASGATAASASSDTSRATSSTSPSS